MAQVKILQAWEGPGLQPRGWECGARQSIACQQQLRGLHRMDIKHGQASHQAAQIDEVQLVSLNAAEACCTMRMQQLCHPCGRRPLALAVLPTLDAAQASGRGPVN